MTRTTIVTTDTLMERVSNHTKETGETIANFISRALLNQLEKDGDYEIRDLIEKEMSIYE